MPAAGDDYYDPLGHRVLWGDSDTATVSPFTKFLLVSDCSWASGTGNYLYNATATAADEDFSLTALYPDGDGPEGNLNQHIRLGIRASGGVADTTETYYVWYIDKEADLYRAELTRTLGETPDDDAYEWTDITDEYELGNFSGAAVHPVSNTAAIIVAYEDPYIWVQYVRWNAKGWAVYTTDAHVVHLTDNIIWSDCHWSDAEVSPSNSDEIVVAVNMSKWGSLASLVYNKKWETWSQTREILPSTEQWGNLRAWMSGMSTINGRIWGVTVREPVGSDDIPFAHHVALVSTADGVNWRDEDFVTTSTLRGKLLYQDGEDYCYVVGNISVARGDASYKLGYDHPNLKHVVDEVVTIETNHAGPSSVPEVSIRAINEGDELSDTGLIETENELVLEMGAEGYDYGETHRVLLAKPSRSEAATEDSVQLSGVGYASRILGANCYRPVAARLYDGPYYLYSRFQFDDSGLPRLTMRQVSGLWDTKKLTDAGHYTLHCKKAGTSLVPHSTPRQHFIARTTFKATASLEGVYFTFWYEDENNYWQAGIQSFTVGGVTPWHIIVIDRYVDGVLQGSDHKAWSSCAARLNTDTWYSMMLEVKPGRIRFYLNESDSYDFATPTDSVEYEPTGESTGPSQIHWVGLKVDPFEGWEGAFKTGTATGGGSNWLTDTGSWFTPTEHQGKWIRIGDQDRQITTVDANRHRLYTKNYWGDEPESGDEYGLYDDDTINGPGAYFRELWFCEGIKPWTIEEVALSMIELAGVSHTGVYTGTGVGALTGVGTGNVLGPKIMGDVYGEFEQNTDATSLALWASTKDLTGDYAYSGAKVELDKENGIVRLYDVVEGAESLVAAHKSMLDLPRFSYAVGKGETWDWTLKWQLYATKGLIAVTTGGHFVTAFPTIDAWRGGYVGTLSAGNLTTVEFPYLIESFIWDSNEPAATALSRLLEGRRAQIIERYDGNVSISRFEFALDDLGTYDVPVLGISDSYDMGQEYSLVEMVGAEDRAFHINIDTALKKLKYIRTDNSALETSIEALNEAVNYLNLVQARHQRGDVTIYAQDPVAELEDKFTVNGQTYIAETISVSMQKNEKGDPYIQATITARKAPEAVVEGVWGDDDEVETSPEFHYDGGTEYA